MKTILETDRLLLREFVMDAVEDFFRMVSDPDVTRFTGDDCQTLVVSVGADHLIQTFSLKDGQLVGCIDVPVKGVYGLAISPDGRYLANAAADGKVRVWQRS